MILTSLISILILSGILKVVFKLLGFGISIVFWALIGVITAVVLLCSGLFIVGFLILIPSIFFFALPRNK